MDKSEVLEILQDQIETVHRCHEGTDEFSHLFYDREQFETHPIPFSGDIAEAKVLTLSANPSPQEFREGTLKNDVETGKQLYEKQQGYFSNHGYRWFETWKEALSFLDASYEASEASCLAAQVDLSPRATMTPSVISGDGGPDIRDFEDMVENDLCWFFELLHFCQDAQLIVTGGTVTKNYYIRRFIQEFGPKYGWELRRMSGEAEKTQGEAQFAFYRLTSSGVEGVDIDLPLFACTSGPSAWDPKLFLDRIESNKERLKELADCGT